MIHYLVVFAEQSVPLEELDVPSVREVLDPISVEISDRLRSEVTHADKLVVRFVIQPGGDVEIDMSGDSDLIDVLDASLDNLATLKIEDD